MTPFTPTMLLSTQDVFYSREGDHGRVGNVFSISGS